MKTSLTAISGIGPDTAKTLTQHGFKSLTAVAGATIEQLGAVPGFGPTRASRTIKAANEVLSHSSHGTASKGGSAPQRKPAPKTAARKPAVKSAGAATGQPAGDREKAAKQAKKLARKAEKEAKELARKTAKKAKKLAEKAAKKAKEEQKKADKKAKKLAKKAKKAAGKGKKNKK